MCKPCNYQKKTKGKGKAKKGKELDELPRFDLTRRWPKSTIIAWQHLQRALEEGDAPRGEICIVKNVQQICEFQAVAKAVNVSKSVLLIAKQENDNVPEHCQRLLLPYLGNLAMIPAIAGNPNGNLPELNEEKVKECKMKTPNRDDLVTLSPHNPWGILQ